MTPIEEVDSIATSIVNSVDGKRTDLAIMSCLEAAVRIIKMTTGLTTIGAIDVIIDSLSEVRIAEDNIPT
jgi:hypothetical protein